MPKLTIMFPNENGIELTVTFENDERFSAGFDVQEICLAGEKADFSEWLSYSALDSIESTIKREIDSAYMCRIAVEYEDAA